MGKDRPARVAEQIQRYLSSRLIPEMRDPRLGFATITGVVISRDLRSARIYVTIYEQDPAKKKEAIATLNGASAHLRRDLGRGLSLRFAPVLHFIEDASIERADRIERLIQEIHTDRGPSLEDESE